MSLGASFVLSWGQRSAGVYFLVPATFFVVWASVIATCEKVTVSDVLGVLHAARGGASQS